MMSSVNQVQMAHSMLVAPKLPDENADLKEVAKQFESLFMHMMLKSMREASRTLSEGNYFNSFETKMYEDMLDEKLSVNLSTTHSLGIADLLVQQLSPQPRQSTYDLKMGSTGVPTRQAGFDRPADFVENLLPQAKAVGISLDVNPKFIVAQAALETGWGEHIMFDAQGNNSHNIFGIKAKSDWQGKTVAIESVEVSNGVAVKERSVFKVYGNYQEALVDYGELIKDNARYSSVQGNHLSIESFGKALLDGGYATDPDYAEKLKRVMSHASLATNIYAREDR